MEQTYYEQCGLMLIKDGRKSRLYKVKQDADNDTLELVSLQRLSSDYTLLNVYPQYNLIVTDNGLYTLDEQTIFPYSGGEVSLHPTEKSLIIVLDYKQSKDRRYCIIWWNGTQKYLVALGNNLIITDKYVALYIERDRYWTVYSCDGTSVLETEHCESQNIEICGDFLLTHSVGNHTIYKLQQRRRYTIQGANVLSKQQLILCSKHDEFAICSDLKGTIKGIYHDRTFEFARADNIEIFDSVSLFCLKRNNRFFLYRFDGTPFAQNLDFVAYNEEQKSLLTGTAGTYRLIKFD